MDSKVYYLTPLGFQKYQEEYKKLKQALKETKSKLKEIRDELWRPEDLNPDYEVLESELVSIEKKLKKSEHILKNARILRQRNKKPQKVIVGSKVIVEINGTTEEFIIVETIEANPSARMISKESPVGRALLDKKVGETVIINNPRKVTYKIKKITIFSQ